MSCAEAREAYEQLSRELFEDDSHTTYVDGRAKFASKLAMIIDQRIKAIETPNASSSQRTDKGLLCKASTRFPIKRMASNHTTR
jgi:hypothetical protein